MEVGVLSYREFCLALAAALSIPGGAMPAAGSVVAGLQLDEISLARLVMKVQELNPWFRLPDQMDIEDIGTFDLYHYYRTMGRQHVEPDGSAR